MTNASNQLSDLSKVTVVVADTGDINAIKKYMPTDATTNPSLLFAAAKLPEYKSLVLDAIQYGRKSNCDSKQALQKTLDKLAVNFGVEILKIVPGLVSTEVDARLSFNTKATVAKAHELISMYADAGISKERVLIKIASTWEGIMAAKQLESEGIHVNMTLLFSLYQAAAAAEAGATLISPFVGRILDWHKKANEVDSYSPTEDPGVISVTKIFNYYTKFGYKTIVMGASFRNKDEILELAGCHKLTIGPKFLAALKESTDIVITKLTPEQAHASAIEKINLDESTFRFGMNDDAMATEKLSEGIRNFTKDTIKLEELIQTMMK